MAQADFQTITGTVHRRRCDRGDQGRVTNLKAGTVRIKHAPIDLSGNVE